MAQKWIFPYFSYNPYTFQYKIWGKQRKCVPDPFHPSMRANFLHGTFYWHTGPMVKIAQGVYLVNIKVTR